MTERTEAVSLRFADTYVWLYSFIQSQNEAKFRTAQQLLRSTEIVLSTQVVNEICRNLLRKANFSEAQLQKIIKSLFRHYQVVLLQERTLAKASDLRNRYSLSFWDSLIVAAALAAGATILYSEDMQHGLVVEQQLRIENPFISI